MSDCGRPWALVLAAGDGRRLRALTTDVEGNWIPKQFCSLSGGDSLLRLALARAGRVVARQETAVVVARDHGLWWRRDLDRLDEANIVVQPCNRGTAIGILLPLLRIHSRDPEARLVLLPSDHFIADEAALSRSLRNALDVVAAEPDRIALLGITPDEADSELGWIVPEEGDAGVARRVACFVEKPPVSLATELMRAGALWNSFILAASASTLLGLFERKMPGIVGILRHALTSPIESRDERLERAYDDFDSRDFSRDLLEDNADRLLVLPVPSCGWSDLGTPRRVARCLGADLPTEPPAILQAIDAHATPALARQLSRL